jgi:hypothetical protein
MKIGFSFFQRVILSLLVILSMVTTSTAFAVPQGFADLTAPLLSAVVNVSTVQKPSKSGGGQKMLPFPEGSPFEEFNQFFEALNNWYIRRNRQRFWKSIEAGKIDQDKQDAYDTLYTALVTMCEASAPLLPFTTEFVWKGLQTH